MRIRKMKESDIGEIVKLIHDVYGQNDVRHFLRDLKIGLADKKESPYRFEDFFVVVIDEKIIAVGGAWALHYEPIARLDWFIVGKERQQKGIGSLLLRHIENHLRKKKISILVAETSSGKNYKAAVAFYQKNGFRKVAEIDKYWEDGSSWVYFMKRF